MCSSWEPTQLIMITNIRRGFRASTAFIGQGGKTLSVPVNPILYSRFASIISLNPNIFLQFFIYMSAFFETEDFLVSFVFKENVVFLVSWNCIIWTFEILTILCYLIPASFYRSNGLFMLFYYHGEGVSERRPTGQLWPTVQLLLTLKVQLHTICVFFFHFANFKKSRTQSIAAPIESRKRRGAWNSWWFKISRKPGQCGGWNKRGGFKISLSSRAIDGF